jgi:hypothetical protein
MMAAILMLAAAPLPVHRRAPCTTTERMIIGAWSDDDAAAEKSEIFPDGDSREIQFNRAAGRRVYQEYLHQRPGGSGTWSLRKCVLTITEGGISTRYTVTELRGDRLLLREAGQPLIEHYHRIGGK